MGGRKKKRKKKKSAAMEEDEKKGKNREGLIERLMGRPAYEGGV